MQALKRTSVIVLGSQCSSKGILSFENFRSSFRKKSTHQQEDRSIERELKELKNLVAQQAAEKRSHESSYERSSPQHHAGACYLLPSPLACLVSHRSRALDFLTSDCRILTSSPAREYP